MSIPNGFREFCLESGADEFHPGLWDDATRASFQAWKIAAFKSRWRAAVENGDTERTRRLCGRDYLVRKVREDLYFAMAPAPTDTYKACPCCPSPAWPSPQGDREPHTRAECLEWLHATFAPGTAARRADLRAREKVGASWGNEALNHVSLTP